MLRGPFFRGHSVDHRFVPDGHRAIAYTALCMCVAYASRDKNWQARIADFAPVCNVLFASAAKLRCVYGERAAEVCQSAGVNTNRGGAEALKLRPSLRLSLAIHYMCPTM